MNEREKYCLPIRWSWLQACAVKLYFDLRQENSSHTSTYWKIMDLKLPLEVDCSELFSNVISNLSNCQLLHLLNMSVGCKESRIPWRRIIGGTNMDHSPIIPLEAIFGALFCSKLDLILTLKHFVTLDFSRFFHRSSFRTQFVYFGII